MLKPGDCVILTKPQKPFLHPWPYSGSGIDYAFGLAEAAWDALDGKFFIVGKLSNYSGWSAVGLEGQKYLWPVECVTLAGTKDAHSALKKVSKKETYVSPFSGRVT
jgi:hypothetical protein